jgi:hypothetical protein
MSMLTLSDPNQTALNAHNAAVAWQQAHAAAAAAGRQPAPVLPWVQNASQLLADDGEALSQKIHGAPYAYQLRPTG